MSFGVTYKVQANTLFTADAYQFAQGLTILFKPGCVGMIQGGIVVKPVKAGVPAFPVG